MNNKEFIAKLSNQMGFTQEESQKCVKTLLDEMGKSFELGKPIQISGFGSFDIKKAYGTNYSKSSYRSKNACTP